MKIRIDSFLKDNLYMFISVSISSMLSFLYQLYVVRKLTILDYGIFNSLISFLVIFSVPLASFQTVIADFISRFKAQEQFYKINYLFYKILKDTFLFSIFFLIFIFIFAPYIAKFLNINETKLLIILGITLVFYLFLPIIQGTLQGLEKFKPLSVNVILHSFARLGVGVILIYLGCGLAGALGSFGISTFIALFIPIFFLKNYLKRKNYSEDVQELKDIRIREILRYFLPTAILLLCFSLLTNMDMVMVKHFFSSQEAGLYSIAQLIGKIVLLFPASVSVVMLPKASGAHQKNKDTLSILNRSLILTAVLCFPVILIIFLFPNSIIKIILGRSYPECTVLVFWFTLAMGIFAVLNIFLYYHLSTRKFYFLPIWAIFTILELVLIIFFHMNLVMVIQVLCLVAFLLLIVNLFFINYARRTNFGYCT